MPATSPVVSPSIFISYAHKDNESSDPAKRWLDRLREQLEPLVQQGQIAVCSDQDIDLGEDWHSHIQQHLTNARAAVLLVSPAFLASKYIRNSELPILLRNAKEQGVRIIPILLRPCLFVESRFKYPDPQAGPEQFSLASLQAAGSPSKALSEMTEGEQDRALLKVAQTLANLANPAEGSADSGGASPFRLRPDASGPIRAEISRIIKYAPAALIGREAETKLLFTAWDQATRSQAKRPHVMTFVALGGEGKTSLVAKWAADLAHAGWPGCDAVFAWSFYSQGAREQTAVSSDLFLKEALTFFGDTAMASSAQSAFDKGRRLAQLGGERKALLILDGLEPLQYAPNSPTPGELKDQGLAALLKGLAATSQGLCVVTTRYNIPDLRAFWQTTAPMHELPRLSTAAGVKLLQTIGVKTGSQAEFEKLVEDVDGHALTLQILGQFLVRAYHGDIRRRDCVNFEKADAKIQGGRAFRAMGAYVEWLGNEGEEARREVALLKMLGLFDRPATADCVAALRQPPAIGGLTEPLVGLAEEDWEFSLSALREAKLLTVNREPGSAEFVALDAHPLLREYFAQRLRQQQPETWRAAHRRLYEYLCATTPDKDDATLEDLQPLYQAIAHGCQAGLQREACDDVYYTRIIRQDESYSSLKLGAIGSDLGAVACFFETPWSRVSSALNTYDQAWLLNEAANRLRALGRLTEALEPVRATSSILMEQEEWAALSAATSNLSGLELVLGDVAGAVRDATQAVIHADRSEDSVQRLVALGIHAHALHQAGRLAEAEARFRDAEKLQAARQPRFPLLYSTHGSDYCDLLLARAERGAWKRNTGALTADSLGAPRGQTGVEMLAETAALLESCGTVLERGRKMFEWRVRSDSLLDVALDHLTLGRVALYAAILQSWADTVRSDAEHRIPTQRYEDGALDFATARRELDAAVSGLRRANAVEFLVRGLLTRAWLLSLTRPRAGADTAQSNLDEACEIAERGPMPLFLADIHLHRARLFFRNPDYPWASPEEDLCEAARLIEKHGYHCRDDELTDAEAALRQFRQPDTS